MTEGEFCRIYASVKSHNPSMQNVSYEEAKDMMLEGPRPENYKLTHSAGISNMWGAVVYALPMVMQMDWKFWVPTDNRRFLTSDDPVVAKIQDEKGALLIKPGWGHPSIEVTSPISPRLCFVATWGQGQGRIDLDGDSVLIINELRVLMSQMFVYSRRREDIQHLFEERDQNRTGRHWKLDRLY